MTLLQFTLSCGSSESQPRGHKKEGSRETSGGQATACVLCSRYSLLASRGHAGRYPDIAARALLGLTSSACSTWDTGAASQWLRLSRPLPGLAKSGMGFWTCVEGQFPACGRSCQGLRRRSEAVKNDDEMLVIFDGLTSSIPALYLALVQGCDTRVDFRLLLVSGSAVSILSRARQSQSQCCVTLLERCSCIGLCLGAQGSRTTWPSLACHAAPWPACP